MAIQTTNEPAVLTKIISNVARDLCCHQSFLPKDGRTQVFLGCTFCCAKQGFQTLVLPRKITINKQLHCAIDCFVSFALFHYRIGLTGTSPTDLSQAVLQPCKCALEIWLFVFSDFSLQVQEGNNSKISTRGTSTSYAFCSLPPLFGEAY